jgi:NitT/TauT family transport system substrate-binding protein
MRRREAPIAPSIDLAYVGLGVHEQLVASAAEQLGCFADEGVQVALRDGRGWPIERLRGGAVVGLGRTQVSRLRDGIPWVILWVNTDRPMFWLVARPDVSDVSDLRGRAVGMHASGSAPGIWARIVLRRHGLDPDVDITPVVIPAGDYGRHVSLLRSGEISAAVIGSTLSAEKVARDEGLTTLVFFGDEIRVPTTGVAVDPTVLDPDGPAVRGLVAGHRRALRTMLEDPGAAIEEIRRLMPGLSPAEAATHHERYVRPHFFADGRAGRAEVVQGLASLATELGGVEVPPLDDLYRNGFAGTDPADR